MVGFILGYLVEIQGLESMNSKFNNFIKPHWKPPTQSFIKLNFDSIFNSHGHASWSRVIANIENGLIMGICTYPPQNINDAFVAEVRACEVAIQFA